jgi:phosphoglycolate phosphatase-like HAD superfamily hydrolase
MAFAEQFQAKDPMPSWNDTAAKKSIVSFVEKTTNEDSADFVPTAERIAVFDNDGTLWSEQPMYFQAIFIFDRIKELAPQHPDWTSKEPFASVLKGDVNAALAGGEHALLEMAMATHAGMTVEEFEKSVTHWVSTAKHPTTGRLYTEMVFQPMLEVLTYLRANGYKTFIVSGGGIDFMRPWAERVYGIPPEQVVGSSIKANYEVRDGKPVLIKVPELNFVDDKGANRSASTSTLAAARSSPSVIPTVTSRCWNGPPPAAGRGSVCSCIMTTRCGSGHTTANRISASSNAASTKDRSVAG